MKSERPKKPKSARPSTKPASTRETPARKNAAPSKARIQEDPLRAPTPVPSILLEGDEPTPVAKSGPGDRYVLGADVIGAPHDALNQALPDAYGTRKVIVFARDPEWLYVHWDFTSEQLRECNAKSADKHMVLRVHRETVEDNPFAEIHVHPESRHWFVHVAQADTHFIVELGYYNRQRRWHREGISSPTLTPPNDASTDHSIRFATLPMEVSMRQLVGMVKQAAKQSQPLVEALQELRDSGNVALPPLGPIATAQWTPAQERALAQVLSIDSVRRVWVGSLEITELVRQQLSRDLSSAVAAQFSLPSSLGASSLSSPFGGGVDRRKGFWFNVNAELIIYGSTEPDARVMIGDRVIKLRSDGSFSYRFALPDGQYELPAVATSADHTDSRTAGLKFSRKTDYTGQVGLHPQDASLRPPKVEHVS